MSRRTDSARAVDWMRDTMRERGLWGAIRHYANGGLELLRDLTPQRRRSRYGDIDYDFDYGVDTTWATISLRTRLRELLSGGQYQPSDPALFHLIVSTVPADPEAFTFIDLGSGKGRTLLMASDYPFRKIIGVELLEELNAIARQNIVRYKSDRQKCFHLESRTGDAKDFEFPAEPIVLYLFNPFPDHVMRAVLGNLRRSLEAAPREIYVIYHNVVHERTFAKCNWLHGIYRTPQFAVYLATIE